MLPNAEMHRLTAGHFAVEDCLEYIAENMRAFHERVVAYAAQHNLDEAAITTSSFSGEWNTTLNGIASEFTDFGKNFSESFRSTLDSLNEAITTLLTTRHSGGMATRRAFEAVAHQGHTSVTSSGLKGIEGLGMNALGIGGNKLGTRSNPMVTQDVSAVLKIGANLLGSAGSSIGAAASSVGGGIGSIFKSALGLIPHFADGGPISACVTALVGENGPEIVNFGQSGNIIPNDKIGAGGGMTQYHEHDYDLKNASDPREIERHPTFYFGVTQLSAVKTGIAGTRERMMRRPRTAGI